MAEENRTTQKGNMTINLFLWILSSSKTTRIPRFYRSAVLQVHLQMPTQRRAPRFRHLAPRTGTSDSASPAQSQPPPRLPQAQHRHESSVWELRGHALIIDGATAVPFAALLTRATLRQKWTLHRPSPAEHTESLSFWLLPDDKRLRSFIYPLKELKHSSGFTGPGL